MTDTPEMKRAESEMDSANDNELAFEPELTVLERLVGLAIDASGDNSAYEDERFVEWLLREAHARMTPAERIANERAADAVVARVQPQLRARQVGEALLSSALKVRDATVIGDIRNVADAAAKEGCAAWLPALAVAAGIGRELWDEQCDRWVELPKNLSRGRYIALAVAGDSMTPYLNDGDTILVDTRRKISNDCIVVARKPDDGYVVKYVSRLSRTTMELSSFNAEYTPFTIARDRNTMVGVVAARLTRGATESD
ncbi:MAG: S24 family peptidase [Gemmatimonadaceae bacterium]